MSCCCSRPSNYTSNRHNENHDDKPSIEPQALSMNREEPKSDDIEAVKWMRTRSGQQHDKSFPPSTISPPRSAPSQPLKPAIRSSPLYSNKMKGETTEEQKQPAIQSQGEGMSSYIGKLFNSRSASKTDNGSGPTGSVTSSSAGDSIDVVPLRFDASLSLKNDSALSDLPDFVDDEKRVQYLDACRLLKKAVLSREDNLSGSEHRFLDKLVQSLGKDSVSTKRLNEAQSALRVLETDPAFQDQTDAFDQVSPSMLSTTMQSREASRASPTNDKRSVASKDSDPVWWNFDEGLEPGLVDEADEEDEEDFVRFDGWSSESAVGTDPFIILGTSIRDHSTKPRVLSPHNMEALRGFFPNALTNQNFLLKFSLVRDGPSMTKMLRMIKGSTWTMIAIETTEGEVFGSFNGTPWRKGPGWFGTGDAFLWRLKKSRITAPTNIQNNPNYEREMEVYPYTGSDELIQFCINKAVGVGGGTWQGQDDPHFGEPQGIGLLIDGDLAGGETNSCATFANPRLCRKPQNRNEFEIANLEVWTLTPCTTVEAAEDLEARRLFIEENVVQLP